MDEFERTGHGHKTRRLCLQRFSRCYREDRSDAFASGQEAVSHAFMEYGRRRGCGRNGLIQETVHLNAFFLEIIRNVHEHSTVMVQEREPAESNKRSRGCQTERSLVLLVQRWLKPHRTAFAARLRKTANG